MLNPMREQNKARTGGGARPGRATVDNRDFGITVLILRRTIVNRTHGTEKKTIYFSIFTDHIWSCLLPGMASGTSYHGFFRSGSDSSAGVVTNGYLVAPQLLSSLLV